MGKVIFFVILLGIVRLKGCLVSGYMTDHYEFSDDREHSLCWQPQDHSDRKYTFLIVTNYTSLWSAYLQKTCPEQFSWTNNGQIRLKSGNGHKDNVGHCPTGLGTIGVVFKICETNRDPIKSAVEETDFSKYLKENLDSFCNNSTSVGKAERQGVKGAPQRGGLLQTAVDLKPPKVSIASHNCKGRFVTNHRDSCSFQLQVGEEPPLTFNCNGPPAAISSAGGGEKQHDSPTTPREGDETRLAVPPQTATGEHSTITTMPSVILAKPSVPKPPATKPAETAPALPNPPPSPPEDTEKARKNGLESENEQDTQPKEVTEETPPVKQELEVIQKLKKLPEPSKILEEGSTEAGEGGNSENSQTKEEQRDITEKKDEKDENNGKGVSSKGDEETEERKNNVKGKSNEGNASKDDTAKRGTERTGKPSDSNAADASNGSSSTGLGSGTKDAGTVTTKGEANKNNETTEHTETADDPENATENPHTKTLRSFINKATQSASPVLFKSSLFSLMAFI